MVQTTQEKLVVTEAKEELKKYRIKPEKLVRISTTPLTMMTDEIEFYLPTLKLYVTFKKEVKTDGKL